MKLVEREQYHRDVIVVDAINAYDVMSLELEEREQGIVMNGWLASSQLKITGEDDRLIVDACY